MNILIIGCGRVGSLCAQKLLDAGHGVVGVRRSDDQEPSAWSMLAGDAADRAFFTYIYENCPQPDCILLTANPGFRADGDKSANASANARTNDNGVIHIIQNIREFYPQTRIIYTSSTYVYGDADGGMVGEKDAQASDQRAGQLLELENQVLMNASAIVFRISALHSERRHFLSTRIQRASEAGTALEIRGPKDRCFNYCHEDDAVQIICAAVNWEQGVCAVYNLTAPDDITYQAYYQHLMKNLDLAITIELREISTDQPSRQVDGRALYKRLPAMEWHMLSGQRKKVGFPNV